MIYNKLLQALIRFAAWAAAFRKLNVQKPKIKTKTETKRVKTPTRGRFAPLAQVPPLLFPFSL